MSDMSWTELDRSEHEVLLHVLDTMRDAVVATTDGLADAQLRAPGVPSGTNLLGLLRHLTAVELRWFELVYQGTDIDLDDSMAVPADVTRDDLVAAYRAVCAGHDALVRATPDLSALAVRPSPGDVEVASLRVIVAHVIAETARHAGHADILREQLDGLTGS